MIGAILGRLVGLNPWVLVTVGALALGGAFSAGWAGGLRWEKVESLRAFADKMEAINAAQKNLFDLQIAQRDAQIKAKTREIAQLEIDRANAALAAANVARQARDAEATAARLEEQYDAVAEALRAARAAAKDSACDCRWSSDDNRRRVQSIRIKPVPPPPGARPGETRRGDPGPDPAAPSGGGEGVHGPRPD